MTVEKCNRGSSRRTWFAILFVPAACAAPAVVPQHGPARLRRDSAVVTAHAAAQERPASRPTGGPETRTTAALLGDDDRLVSWVVAHDAVTAAARARSRQTEADHAQSRLWQNPSVGVQVGGMLVGEANPPSLPWSRALDVTGTLSQPLDLWKRGPRIEAARLRAGADASSLLDTVGDRVHDIRGLLGLTTYLKARIALIEENLESARGMLRLEQTRQSFGDISGVDLDRIRLDTIVLEQELPSTRAELGAALAKVTALLGAEFATTATDLGALDHAAPVPDEGNGGFEAALLARPDVRAIDLQIGAADQDLELARKKVLPDPTLSLSYTHDELVAAGNQRNTVGVGITFELPIVDRGQHAATKAEQAGLEVRKKREALLADAAAEITSLLQKQSSLAANLKALRDDAEPRSKRILDTTLESYRRGQVGLTDLLLARRTHTELLLRSMDLAFQTFQVRNDLRHALGLDAALAARHEGLRS